MVTPNMLAHGVVGFTLPLADELFAGERPVTTDRAKVGAAVLMYQVITFNENGEMVPWTGLAGRAVGTVTFAANPAAADTITIGGHVITFRASGAVGAEVNIGATTALTAAALKAYLDANAEATGVTASIASNVLTLIALNPGAAGNSITLAKSGTNPTISGATLAGGGEETEAFARGVAGQAQATVGKWTPYYTGGDFNHDALVWPAHITTLAERKRAFQSGVHTIGVNRLP